MERFDDRVGLEWDKISKLSHTASHETKEATPSEGVLHPKIKTLGSPVAPPYLRNVIRIITETGLRVYKELACMKKSHLDLENGTVWIPDSKTPNGVAEVPLTDVASDAFRAQLELAGPGEW